MRHALFLSIALVSVPLLATAQDTGCNTGPVNDYPTAARADYVFACMNENGGSQQALDRCSCAIDVIATLLPYKDYEDADTVLRMQQSTGYLASEFRSDVAKNIVRQLQEAQAEATVRCF